MAVTSDGHPQHHLLPQFYLNRFGRGKGKWIEVVDRSDLNRSWCVRVRDALSEEHFYSIETDDGLDPQIETMFANNVEGPAATALKDLVNRAKQVSTPNLKIRLATFFAFQCVRGYAARRSLVEFYKGLAQKTALALTPEIIQAESERRGEPMSRGEAVDLYEFAQSGEYEVGMSGQGNWHLGIALPVARRLIEVFCRRKWQLLEFAAPVLATCDEPIVAVAESGMLGEAAGLVGAPKLLFPTDPRHALIMVRPDLTDTEQRYTGDAESAAFINAHVAFNACRYIVLHPDMNPLMRTART